MCSYGKSNSFGAMWQSSTTSAALTRARLADLAPHLTPYRYAFNNPIRYHDPSGLFEVARDGGGEPDPNPDVIIYSTKSVFSIEVDRIRTPFANATSYNPWDNFKSQLTGMYAKGELMKQNTTSTSSTQSAKTQSSLGRSSWYLGIFAILSDPLMDDIHSSNLFDKGVRRGVNGNYTLIGRNAKLFNNYGTMNSNTRPITNYIRYGKILGYASFGLGFGTDVIGVYNYYYNPLSSFKVHPNKFAVNSSFGVLGIKLNPLVSILYFGVDNFYPGGWIGDNSNQGAIMNMDRLTKSTQEIVPKFNPFRDVRGGF